MTAVFDLAPLERGSNFEVIYADPAWHHRSNSKEKPGRNALRHYDCMSLAEIRDMPVRDYIAPEAVLFMWITGPLLVIGAHIPIMKAWGFKPTAMGFVWIKTNKNAPTMWIDPRDDLFFGGGHTTRKNAEYVVIGKRGKSLRKSKSIPEVLIAPIRRHSEKPEEIRERIVEYVGEDRRKAELFARKSTPGWETWGNERTKFDGYGT